MESGPRSLALFVVYHTNYTDKHEVNMFIARRVYCCKNSLVRLCSTESSAKTTGKYKSEVLYDQSKFSMDEQVRILSILNESPLEELYKLDATKTRINKIEIWRTRKGPFKLLSDVLEVEGFGIKVFEKLCHSILHDTKSNYVNNPTSNSIKSRKTIVTPLIDRETASAINSAVSLHLTQTCISWCKILRQGNTIDVWNFHDFSNIPKKMSTCELVHLAINIISRIPFADAYVFETPVHLSPQAKQKMTASASHTQQMELSAMLTALLNTNAKHNRDFNFEYVQNLPLSGIANYNKVYFLRSFLSARLFNMLVGNEMISAISTIDSLLNLKVPEKDLPCTQLRSSPEIQQYYSSQSAINKHLLGQALLQIISFMDICIYKNPISTNVISPNKKTS